MRSKIFQTYIPACAILYVMLCTTAVCIEAGNAGTPVGYPPQQPPKYHPNTPNTPARHPQGGHHQYNQPVQNPPSAEWDPHQGKQAPEVVNKDPFASIVHLDLPDDVIDFLLAEYEEGVFKKVELGGTYGESKGSLQWRLIGAVFGFIALTTGVIVVGISVGPGIMPVFLVLNIFLTYFWLSFALLYSFSQNYNKYLFPGYLFVTDVGMLLIEQGSMDQFSWLYYRDIQHVNDIFVLVELDLKRVLRVIDKVGQIQDYYSELIDTNIYHSIYSYVESKVRKK